MFKALELSVGGPSLSETVLTFRYLSSRVTGALASIVFNLLFHRMPSEFSRHPPLDFNKLLIGFVTAKLHLGPWHPPAADYLAPMSMYPPPVRLGFGAGWVLQNTIVRGDGPCSSQNTRFQNTLCDEGTALPLLSESPSSYRAVLEPTGLFPSPSGEPWLSSSTGMLWGLAPAKCTAAKTWKADFFKRK